VLAVLFIDLNEFKRINDNYGHDCGDSVLRELAQRLSAAVRPDDTVGRVSGVEFLAICEDLTGALEALSIADRIVATLAPPVSLAAGEMTISASIGIAMTAHPDTPAQVLSRRADTAMYEAKRLGGPTSRVHLGDDDAGGASASKQ
jgi:diguanylate cyclase (GGDEF)-like protein